MATVSKNFIVVVDDDPTVARVLSKELSYRAHSFPSGAQMHDLKSLPTPIAVFVDVHLENGESGLELVTLLRYTWPLTPILVITSDVSGECLATALSIGADDFIRKPFDPFELSARVQARIRHYDVQQTKLTLRFGDLRLDVSRRVLSVGEQWSYLPILECRLLAHLIRKQGAVESANALKRILWGSEKRSDNALHRKIYELRNALKSTQSSVSLNSCYKRGFYLVKPGDEEPPQK